MSITNKIKEEIKDIVLHGIGEEIVALNNKIDALVNDNNNLLSELCDIKRNQLELFQRVSKLEGKFELLADVRNLQIPSSYQIPSSKILPEIDD